MDAISVLLTLTAAFAYHNARFLKRPMTIGVMASALRMSLLVVVFDAAGMLPDVRAYQESLLQSVDFSELLMLGMLSLLLIAGALCVNLQPVRSFCFQVAALAIFGRALSTVLVGVAL